MIIRLQQETIFFGETVSTTRLHLQYMKEFSMIEELKSFIATKIIYLIKLIDNNRK